MEQPSRQRQPSHELEGFLFSESAISSDLIEAYRATDYHVDAETPFVLTVGQASPALGQLYSKHRCQCAAYVTASNPFSQVTNDADNQRRHAELVEELKNRSLHFVEGMGRDSRGQWPGEASCLVLGLSLEAAKKLGRHYGQNALVWCGPDTVPQLVLLR